MGTPIFGNIHIATIKRFQASSPQKKHMHNANIHPFRCGTYPRLPDGDMILGTGNGLLTRISVRDPSRKPWVFFELISELLKTVPVFFGGVINPPSKKIQPSPLPGPEKGHQVIKSFLFFWGGGKLPSRELTYPNKNHVWRWFSLYQGGIC